MCKRFLVAFLLLGAVFAVALFPWKTPQALAVGTKPDRRRVIILDAGHGGFDGGAVASDGTVEKDINLKIALTLRDFLQQDGFLVVMTRDADISTEDPGTDTIPSRKKSDMQNRLQLMSDYPDAIFVSIHLNKFTTSAARGAQIFYGGQSPESQKLGESIRVAITDMLQPDNTRVNKQATSGTYLLYHAPIPAVLVECGFLSNRTELALLKEEAYQQKMAFCIFCGIKDYFSA